MKQITARLGLALGIVLSILLTATQHSASAQDRPVPSPKTTGPVRIAAAAPDGTCSKFLPNVGIVMTVPCSLQPDDGPSAVAPRATEAKAATAPSPPVQLASRQAKAPHKASRMACSEILLRIQLDDIRNNDHERLRDGC